MNPWYRRAAFLWILAIAITLSSVAYQRLTGPTHPVRIKESWQGMELSTKLTRTHGGPGDQLIHVNGITDGVSGDLIWRRYPTREEFQRAPMQLVDGVLSGRLPHQMPAGKLEYHVEVRASDQRLRLPADGEIITRFKGAVPLGALIPHIIIIFAAMLIANRAGLAALVDGARQRFFAWFAFTTLTLGGMILGPVVQKYAFGAYWTGFPFGHDLTDNKTLIAWIGWIVALALRRFGRWPRAAIVAAAVLTLVIYLIPHSLLGSELSYE